MKYLILSQCVCNFESMKSGLILVATPLLFLALSCQSNGRTMEKRKVSYDSTLAMEYGADKYGMKKYVMAFLKRGPNRDLDESVRDSLQALHLQNIGRLAEEGKLVLAGPFFGDGDMRGIYILNASSLEEAKKLTETDPSIKAGSLVMELKEWYGSAALMGLNDLHKQVEEVSVTE